MLDGAGHFHGSEELCRVHWTGEALSDSAASSPPWRDNRWPSFIGTDIDRIRRLIGLD